VNQTVESVAQVANYILLHASSRTKSAAPSCVSTHKNLRTVSLNLEFTGTSVIGLSCPIEIFS